MSASGIYAITHRDSGKMYIGSAVSIGRRWQDHRKRLRGGLQVNPHLQSAWNKYGEEAFDFDVVEWVEVKERLVEREQVWIDFFKPTYNVCRIAGSSLGLRRSQATRDKISAGSMGNANALRNKGRLGQKNTPEVCAAISARMRGKKTALGYKHTPEWCAASSKWRTGRKATDEARANMSAAAARLHARERESRANT